MTVFGYTLRRLRKAVSLSEEALGAELGFSGATIANLESGYIAPSEEHLERLAEYFNVTQGYLLGCVEICLCPEGSTNVPAAPTRRYVQMHPLPLGDPETIDAVYVKDVEDAVVLPLSSEDDNLYTAFRISDNSMMSCRMNKGDTVIVCMNSAVVREGDIALAHRPDTNGTFLARFSREGMEVSLRTDFEDLRFPLSEVEYRVLGKIVQIIVDVNQDFLEQFS